MWWWLFGSATDSIPGSIVRHPSQRSWAAQGDCAILYNLRVYSSKHLKNRNKKLEQTFLNLVFGRLKKLANYHL